ncbi:hypothetical protein [Couchioplanes caeruleus]|uniref:SurA-like protein n=2 Tax=Couchioplanes caeruleus TaxID=56438 RepID=A0A1K0GZ44_9ACTN|nr:hypothetical protein [Couchioplanes caeruleus]OJF14699.1 hypothetical protein BG844_08680 [Couchioplanes caeruleus subsp. caeruleus]ROP30101.1 hypothetical protein EDD30_2934 [Couchioplanes caeruleus]
MTMQRARRLASTAVVAVLAVAGLTACQQSPDVAAYTAGGKITEDRIQVIYDQVRDQLTEARAQAQRQGEASGATEELPPPVMPIKQQDVLNTLLSVDILRKSAQAHGVSPAGSPTVEQVAQARNYSPEWEFTQLYAETYRLRTALQSAVKPAQLTEADLRDVFGRLVKGGAADPNSKFEEFQSTLSPENKSLLESYVAMRTELERVVADQKVKINPRYGAQQVTLLSAQGADGKDVPLVVLSLSGDDAEDAYVTDVSAVTTVA